MAAIPQRQHTTVTVIGQHYAAVQKAQKPRPHLGASIIGKACSRALWYDFRWATRVQFSPRMLRLFETGNREEFRMVVDLRNAGVTVIDKDPASGKQIQFKDVGGHFSGSMDAALVGLAEAPKTWHVGEFKTHNAASFAKLYKDGVKISKPQHWHQMNTYMGWSTMHDSFYLAHNKNNDDLFCDRFKFDQATFNLDREKATRIINAPNPLAKIADKADSMDCMFCDHKDVCHVGRAPAVSCRTCVHSTAVVDDSKDGKWTCARYNIEMTTDQQIDGCASHLLIPSCMPFAEAIDASEEYIVYRHKVSGRKFCNATAVGIPPVEGNEPMHIYTSTELSGLHPNLVGDPKVEEMRKEFGGTILAPAAIVKDDE